MLTPIILMGLLACTPDPLPTSSDELPVELETGDTGIEACSEDPDLGEDPGLGIMRRPGTRKEATGFIGTDDVDTYFFDADATIFYRAELDGFEGELAVLLLPYPYAHEAGSSEGFAPLSAEGPPHGYHPWKVVVRPLLASDGSFLPACTPYTLVVESFQ